MRLDASGATADVSTAAIHSELGLQRRMLGLLKLKLATQLITVELIACHQRRRRRCRCHCSCRRRRLSRCSRHRVHVHRLANIFQLVQFVFNGLLPRTRTGRRGRHGDSKRLKTGRRRQTSLCRSTIQLMRCHGTFFLTVQFRRTRGRQVGTWKLDVKRVEPRTVFSSTDRCNFFPVIIKKRHAR